MHILFINPPWIRRKDNVWNNVASVMPPLGLAWMASMLEHEGHNVRILDAHAERLDFNHLSARLVQLGHFDLVGITASTPLISNAYIIAKLVKEHFAQTKVALGGVHPTVLPEEVLREPAVDLVVRGEGEKTICELAAGKPPAQIQGISFRINNTICHNPERPLIKDLDSLPAPAYHLLPMDKYYAAAGAALRHPVAAMLATRGCVGRCTFCYRMFGHHLRIRSGQKIAEEVKFLQDNYGIREICFYDDTFTMCKKEVYAFCQALEDMKLDITWVCFSRVDTIDEKLLYRMKQTGCHQISYGIESACPEILQNIGKNTDCEKAEHSIRLTKKVGIDVRAAFMLGNPGETEETMEETLAFAIRLNPEIAMFNITTPFPGTEMFEWADKHNYIITKNWDDYDLAHPVLELPTVSSKKVQEFYRKAYRRFFLRPSYLARRIARLRHYHDVVDAYRALRALVGI